MTAFVISLATLVALFVLVAALPFGYAGWRRAFNRRSELEIWKVMRRMGLSPAGAPANDAKMAHAIRRCTICPSLDACDEWLASGRTDRLDEFCPNAAVIEGLRKP